MGGLSEGLRDLLRFLTQSNDGRLPLGSGGFTGVRHMLLDIGNRPPFRIPKSSVFRVPDRRPSVQKAWVFCAAPGINTGVYWQNPIGNIAIF